MTTRAFVPVDMPVSLAPGHVKADFYTNLEASYFIEIELDQSRLVPGCLEYAVLKTRWTVFRDGRVVAAMDEDKSEGGWLGYFDSTPGRYTLDVDVLSDASCLSVQSPRLRVSTYHEDYSEGEALLILISITFGGGGLALVLITLTAAGQAEITPGQGLAIFATLRAQNEASRGKLLLMGPGSTLPTVGYVWGITYFVLFVVCAPFLMGSFRWPSRGIPVRLLRPGVIQARTDRQTTGLLVYVDQNRKLYLGSKPVTAEELPPALEKEFARRADWSVYVEGDSNASYGDVVWAMDLVRSSQGKVIMLTPNMRAEAQAGHN